MFGKNTFHVIQAFVIESVCFPESPAFLHVLVALLHTRGLQKKWLYAIHSEILKCW